MKMSKKVSFIVLLFCLLSLMARPQSCLPNGITFLVQADIDYFHTLYPGCTEIEGDVTISSMNIENLNGLSVLTHIGGNLSIGFNFNLESLAGLDNLTTIDGNCTLTSNILLVDLMGLGGLTTVGGSLVISGHNTGNPDLLSLNGLDNLMTIGGELNIYECDELITLAGLENLVSIGSNLQIGGNDSLVSLAGISGLTVIPNVLNIQANPSLVDLNGLENLTYVGGHVCLIHNNQSLTSLTGLESLTSTGGEFKITSNQSLASLEGIGNLSETGGFYLWANHNLTDITDLHNLVTVNSWFGITENLSLSSLAGLENLNTIHGDFDLSFNTSLTSLEGLSSLDSVYGSLGITGNDMLADLEGMESLHFIGSNLIISRNNGITNLAGLEGLESVGGSVLIDLNPVLANLEALNILDSIPVSLELSGNPLITNLSGLDNLVFVGETVKISGNNSLTSLAGLNNVTFIGGSLVLEENVGLAGLSGLASLERIGGTLRILMTYAMTSLQGLENVTSIGGNLDLESNHALTGLTGLNNLDSLGGGIFLRNHINLSSLGALDGVTSIGDDLVISGNTILGSLAGLNNLAGIDSNIVIHDNPQLAGLSALSGLQRINGQLALYNLPMLQELTGLDNIDPGSINYLSIHDNTNLSGCTVQSVCFYLAAPGAPVEIYNNLGGCNTRTEIEDACEAIYPMTVWVYADEDTVCMNDSVELHSVVTGNIGTCTYSWSSIPPGFTSSAPNPIATPQQATSYILHVTAGYQTADDTVPVSVFPISLAVSAQEDTVCYNDPVQLVSELSCSGNNAIYDWTSVPPGFTSNLANPVAYPQQVTWYKLHVTIGNQSADDSVLVQVNAPSLSVSALEDSVCVNDTVHLYSGLNCSGGIYSFTWTSDPPGFNSSLPDPLAFPTGSSWYFLRVETSNQTLTDSIFIATFASPESYFLSGGGTMCEDDPGFEIKLDGSQPGTEYSLLRNNEMTGVTVQGTGGPINFGFQTNSGMYKARATVQGTGCKADMLGQAVIGYYYYGQSENICMVSVDSAILKNILIWQKTPDEGIESYNIYRESTTGGSYEFIANISHSEPGYYMDIASNPIQRSYTYGLSTIDTCGHESFMGSLHTTMHLSINTGIDAYNLIWTPYTGFNYETYYIYRREAGNGFQLLDSVPNSINALTDSDPPDGVLDYMIEIRNAEECGTQKGTNVYSSVFSNIISTNVGINDTGEQNDYLLVFPNPSEGKTTLRYSKDVNRISIYNMIGVQIRSIMGAEIHAGETIIDLVPQGKGVYSVKATLENGMILTRLLVVI